MEKKKCYILAAVFQSLIEKEVLATFLIQRFQIFELDQSGESSKNSKNNKKR
ncbi:Hypothetical predicted protein [Pelobates cultripes]|uniref:Uncharacterized protein n=1 Tax=Pelobates cultripes TaxID=61616 RepID=A0AAD1R017_PELCU|nr:Hypothetical predicted protein [Pelobates cultripes]